jgi:hypothetical protein
VGRDQCDNQGGGSAITQQLVRNVIMDPDRAHGPQLRAQAQRDHPLIELTRRYLA